MDSPPILYGTPSILPIQLWGASLPLNFPRMIFAWLKLIGWTGIRGDPSGLYRI